MSFKRYEKFVEENGIAVSGISSNFSGKDYYIRRLYNGKNLHQKYPYKWREYKKDVGLLRTGYAKDILSIFKELLRDGVEIRVYKTKSQERII